MSNILLMAAIFFFKRSITNLIFTRFLQTSQKNISSRLILILSFHDFFTEESFFLLPNLLPISFPQSLLNKPDFEFSMCTEHLKSFPKKLDFIQSSLYKNSLKISKRNTGILYYDCTNYFFEIEQEDGLKQYGASKEHRPNPIVQMGLVHGWRRHSSCF